VIKIWLDGLLVYEGPDREKLKEAAKVAGVPYYEVGSHKCPKCGDVHSV
jgi:hypothetical protein